MARPKKELNWEVIDKLCEFQATQEEIAQFCECSVDTLDRRSKELFDMSFADYFDEKRGKGKISLRRAQWQSAQKGNATLLIWLGKQYLGQKDRSATELSGPDGGPIEAKNVSQLPDDELTSRIRLLENKSKGVEEG